MKICGTVVRPLARWIISARFGPPMVMSILLIGDALGVEQPLGARCKSRRTAWCRFRPAPSPSDCRALMCQVARREQRAPSTGCSRWPRRRASARARRHWRWRRWYRRRRPGGPPCPSPPALRRWLIAEGAAHRLPALARAHPAQHRRRLDPLDQVEPRLEPRAPRQRAPRSAPTGCSRAARSASGAAAPAPAASRRPARAWRCHEPRHRLGDAGPAAIFELERDLRAESRHKRPRRAAGRRPAARPGSGRRAPPRPRHSRTAARSPRSRARRGSAATPAVEAETVRLLGHRAAARAARRQREIEDRPDGGPRQAAAAFMAPSLGPAPVDSQAKAAHLARAAARWRSGYAEDCKSLHAGSIPARASIPQQPCSFQAPSRSARARSGGAPRAG